MAPEALAWNRPGLNPGSHTSWPRGKETFTYFHSYNNLLMVTLGAVVRISDNEHER